MVFFLLVLTLGERGQWCSLLVVTMGELLFVSCSEGEVVGDPCSFFLFSLIFGQKESLLFVLLWGDSHFCTRFVPSFVPYAG